MPDLGVLANWSTILALVVTIIATIIVVLQGRRTKNEQSLTYILYRISSPFLVGTSKTIESDIQIYYKGKDIKNLNLMEAKLKNTSNIPIRRTHIVEPVTFTFKPDVELLREPQIISTDPPNLKVDWHFVRPNEVNLSFELLNPDDELTVEFVWTGQKEEPEVTARIEGIRKVNRIEAEQVLSWGLRASLIGGFTLQILILMVIVGITVVLPIILLIGTNILNPQDFYVGIVTGFVLLGTISFLLNRLQVGMRLRRNQYLREVNK